MQNVDSSVRVLKRGRRLTSIQDATNPNATYIPAANQTAQIVAEQNGGIAAGHIGDLVGAPFTAHFVGGCVVGADASRGVLDAYHRVWGYPTLHVVDGSAITANLGVNPSLTITAQAERAFSMWPNKGDEDPRPAQSEPYRRLSAVAPLEPAVPATAPGALRVHN
jgi:cholesterol oxidase